MIRLSKHWDFLKARFFAALNNALLRAGLLKGIKAGFNLLMVYSLLGIPILWTMYLLLVPKVRSVGIFNILIIVANMFISMAIGFLPALFLGAIGGIFLAWLVGRVGMGMSSRQFALISLVIFLSFASIVGVILFLLIASPSFYFGSTNEDFLIAIFPYLIGLGFPILFIAGMGTWLGYNLHSDSRKITPSSTYHP
jgi:hypothetical protein